MLTSLDVCFNYVREAQLDVALCYEHRGCGFDSLHGYSQNEGTVTDTILRSQTKLTSIYEEGIRGIGVVGESPTSATI